MGHGSPAEDHLRRDAGSPSKRRKRENLRTFVGRFSFEPQRFAFFAFFFLAFAFLGAFEFKRRIKTQTVLPSADTAAMLFWALLASGQINMRKVDGWQTLTVKPSNQPIDLAA